MELYTHDDIQTLAFLVATNATSLTLRKSENTVHLEDCDAQKRNCFHASLRYTMGSVSIQIRLIGRTSAGYKRQLEGGMVASFVGNEEDLQHTTHTLYTLIAGLMHEFGWTNK